MGIDIGDTLVSAVLERGGETVRTVSFTRQEKLNDLLYAVRLGDTLRITVSRAGSAKEFSYTFDSAKDFTEVL